MSCWIVFAGIVLAATFPVGSAFSPGLFHSMSVMESTHRNRIALNYRNLAGEEFKIGIHDSTVPSLYQKEHYLQLLENIKDLVIKDYSIKGSRDVAERMLLEARRAAAEQRHRLQGVLERANRRRLQAIQDQHLAEIHEKEACDEVVEASLESRMLESVLDVAYEDVERLRETARLHAVRQKAIEAHGLVLEHSFKELEAEVIMIDASGRLAWILEYEMLLKKSLRDLETLKRTQMRKQWENMKA